MDTVGREVGRDRGRILNLNLYNVFVILFVALGSMTYGYGAAIISSTLGQTSFIAYFQLDTRSNATALEGATNGVFQAGGLIGALGSSYVADRWGRRGAILTAAVICVIGGALQAGSVNIIMFIIMRLVTGVGIGMMLSLVPLYQSEVAPPASRGLLVGVHGIMLGVGYLLSGWISVGFYYVPATTTQWRVPLALQVVPPLALLIGFKFLVESPRYLLLKGRDAEALAIVKNLHRDSKDPYDLFAQQEYKQIKRQHEIDLDQSVSWLSLFRQKSYRRRCILGFFTMLACQCTGTLVIANYGPTLYAGLGYSPAGQLLMQAAYTTIIPFGNATNAFLSDKLGRVRMIIFGFCGTIVALIGETIIVALFAGKGNTGANAAGVFFLYMHNTIYTSCLDATSYIYTSELFPNHIRTKGMSFSVSGLFVATIILLQSAPTAFAAIGWKFYLVFIACTTLDVILVIMFFPETKGLPLEEIGKKFGDHVVTLDLNDIGEDDAASEDDKVVDAQGAHILHKGGKDPSKHLESAGMGV